MTREEKCLLAINLGFNYFESNGIIQTPRGSVLSKKTKNGYLMLTLRDKKRNIFYLFAHQFAWYFKYRETVDLIDHKNGIKTDNSISNLRSVSKSQNAMNMKNVIGYCFCKRSKKFIASIMVNYKKIHLGSFENKDDAINCYKVNKEKYHKIN